jgi:predicted RecA/RadA family phage recombinase
MKNFVQPGRTITLTAPYILTSGQGALVGTIVGIANSDIASGSRGEFDTEGVFDVTKAAGTAWTEGATIYWDNAAKNFTTVSTSNTKAGVAVANDATGTMAASADVVGRLRLNGSF